MFQGSFVALVTPFKNGKIDEDALKNLIEFQVANGTNGIVPCGTTGEAATLSIEEHNQVIDIAVGTVNGRIPVIAGTGSNSTKEAIKMTIHAKETGANAALLITPYYNKPTQEGLYQHFKKIAGDVDIPIIVYNVPGRTSVNMLPATTARLSEIKNIVGIKEASGSLQQVSETIKLCGENFSVISGDDANTLPIMAAGGKGVISVTANIAPDKIAALCKACLDENFSEARKLHYELLDLNIGMFIETSPGPVKTALFLMGKVTDEVRLPLASMNNSNLSTLKSLLKKSGLV
ncbi:MAG TPA: 4-hydroxy-tetrahydrodipicolinate synthase [Nitrospinota bacterium]|jgi:4-hydroxy-tetrahydrodipicolinate synthase|nr:4-hydroxy-tetrahydrodipicolinate synthase [Nitrospinota bacterium]HJN02084.1 4-hydroxy-tetrahydrodipicolinate synthase [Nitrospinota bacterium]|tara:strand:+ start:2944 stop:3816 length:873 start_codon:yes stop_codon:yes gene_type:complete